MSHLPVRPHVRVCQVPEQKHKNTKFYLIFFFFLPFCGPTFE